MYKIAIFFAALWSINPLASNAKASSPLDQTDGRAANILLIGESNTAGNGNPLTPSYASILQGLLAPSVRLVNIGAGGFTIQQMETAFALKTGVVCADSAGAVAVLWPGANDIWLTGSDAVTVWERIAAFIPKIQAAGCSVVIATEPDRGGSPLQIAAKDRLTKLIREYATQLGARIADVAADPNIGSAGSYANKTYFYDNAHFTSAGALAAASILQQAILSILRSNPHADAKVSPPPTDLDNPGSRR
jgi:hypothetical protein